MSSINAGDVDARLDRLREEYAPVVEREDATLAPGEFDDLASHARDGYTGGGYAWVVREEPVELGPTMPDDVDESYPRVLLALGRGADGWGPAGGGRETRPEGASPNDRAATDGSREDGETYEDAAVREVREETGVACEVVDCRRVRKTVFTREDREAEIHTLWVYFVARETGGSIDVLESELNGAAWFHEVPEDRHWAVEDHPWEWDEWDG